MHVEKNLFMFSWAREKALTTNGLAEVTLPALTALTHRSSKVEFVEKGSRVRYGNGGVPLFLVWRLQKMSTLRFSSVHEARTSFNLIISKKIKILLDTASAFILASMSKQGL